MIRPLAALVLLSLATLCSGAPPALIGLAGEYGKNYRDTAGRLGAETVSLTNADLASPDALRKLDLLIISHLHAPLSAEAEEALASWVADGGKLWLEIAAFPPQAILDAPRISGWAPYVEMLRSDGAFTRGEQAGAKLKYGAWGGGITVQEGDACKVLARWVMEKPEEFGHSISESYRDRPAAMLEIRHGKGLCLWSGAGLWILRPSILAGVITELVGPERLPLKRLQELLATDVSEQASAPWAPALVVGVFADRGFPRVSMPAACSGDFIADTLTPTGVAVKRLTAEDLLDPKVFDADVIGVLVLGSGEAFPLEAVANLKRFLARGGAVLSCAGIPLSHLCVREGDGWRDLGAVESIRRGSVHLVFERLLPLAKVFESEETPAMALNVAPDWLPGLPTVWPLRGGATFLMCNSNGLSSHTTQRLVASVSEAGDVMGLPVQFNPYDSRFPRARFLALGFRGESHPFNPEAWPSARPALVQFVRLVARRNYVYVADLWTREPLYLNGETVEIGARILGRTEEKLRCKLTVQQRDDGKAVYSRTTEAFIKPGEPTDLEWQWAPATFDTWAYDVIVEVAALGDDPPPPAREETEFLAWDEDVARSARDFSIGPDGVARRAGKGVWLSGANPYTCDGRGIGFFFSQTEIPGRHALVDFTDRDESWIKLVGGNALRMHYLEYKITPDSFTKPGAPHELRLLDAYNLLAAFHDHVSLLDPFTFSPDRREEWIERCGEGDPYTDPRWRKAERQLFEGLAKRCSRQGFENIVWELINEPERYGRSSDEAERRELAANVASWVKEMQDVVREAGGGPAGIGHSTAPLSQAWDPRANLFPLPLSNVHHYGGAHLQTGNGVWCPAFGLNYGRPCVVGEFGLPNAGRSRTPHLSDWSGPYDRVLHACLGEGAVGFINFYLNCSLAGINAPEWGMIRPDYSEKPAGLVWKRWNQLLRFVAPDELGPATLFILFDSDERLARPAVVQDLYQAYAALLSEGVYAQVISEKDLGMLMESKADVEAILKPESLSLTPQAAALLSKAEAAGAKVFETADDMIEYARPRLPARVVGGALAGAYIRPMTDGGCLVVLMEGDGREVTLRANERELSLSVPEGRCATVRLTKEGEVRLVEAYGPVRFDGETLCDGPSAGYLVAAADGRAISKSEKLRVWAEHPGAVSIAGQTPGLSALAVGGTDPGSVPTRGQPGVVLALAGDQQAVSLLRRQSAVRIVAGPAKTAIHCGSARVDLPWSGAIVTVSKDPLTILVVAPTVAGVELAARKLAALRDVGSYTSGPFAPLDW